MIKKIGDNIISSLGFTTDENYRAVESGISGVKFYNGQTMGLPEDFMASIIDKEKLNELFSETFPISSSNLTDFEKAAILSAFTANEEANIDLSDDSTLFVISTTKGNVNLLDVENRSSNFTDNQIFLWHSAKTISGFFNNPNTPVIISNACISGASAQIAAMRELENNHFAHTVVVGIDFLSKFIISGFQSFKALSAEPCRPFDKDRTGLNLGEAAATIIYEKTDTVGAGTVVLRRGAIRNDANHISGPSRTGEGSFRALNYILKDIDKSQVSFVNAHGTATPYNDAMEAVALTRADLNFTPVNSLKPFFGHTLGAAGVLESIISMRALTEKSVLKSLNFNTQDFENSINISKKNDNSDKIYFIKMLSGFGGCNAALLFERG